MISRVAESCFWLQRYVERAESTARLVRVNSLTVLDAQIHDAERWRPVVVVLGEEKRFVEVCGAEAFNVDDRAERYLTWEEDNPMSIKNCVYWARENARTIREVIGQGMWETLNTLWHWLSSDDAQRLFTQDRALFYQRVEAAAAEFQGVCHSTMLHEEPFEFMRLGLLLERINQTARVIDVKHHMLDTAFAQPNVESPWESAQWAALLSFCAGTETFLKRVQATPSGPAVAEFLLKEQAFPRSVVHGLDRARNFLQLIQRSVGTKRPPRALQLILPLLHWLKTTPIEEIFAAGLHEKLTEIIDTTARACDLVHAEFFDPGPDRLHA